MGIVHQSRGENKQVSRQFFGEMAFRIEENKMRKFIWMSAAVAMLATPMIASARAPRDLSDLTGMRASSFDGVMGDRGYQYIRNRGLTQYWWKANSNACISAVTSNGRISNIQMATPRDCGKAGGGGGVPAGNGLGGLNGMDSIKAIDVMSSRGFTNVDTITTPGTLYGIFYNPRTRVCAQLMMADQKVMSVDPISNPKCR